MNLAALFAAHKAAVLGAAAAGVGGLALLSRKKTAAAASGTTAAATQVTPGAGAYDSSAYDVYSALQSELEPLLQEHQQQTQGNSITITPAPVTSPLIGDPKMVPGQKTFDRTVFRQPTRTPGWTWNLPTPTPGPKTFRRMG